MRQIVIFDDNAKDIAVTEAIIGNHIKESNEKAEIYTFTELEELMGHLRERPDTNIVFMDIVVDGEAAGIKAAGAINRLCTGTRIVFLTGYLECATDIYDTRHIYFVLKQELGRRLPAVFRKIWKLEQMEQPSTICFKEKGFELFLYESDIFFFEREKRVTYIYCKEKKHIIKEKLTDIQKTINTNNIIRCHNSFLVNLHHIQKLKRTAIILQNGIELPVSRSRLPEVRRKFLEWSQKYL